jgi:ABC-2 type transport system permease protein
VGTRAEGQSKTYVVGVLINLLTNGAMLYSFYLMLATSTVWIVRADNILVIFEEMFAAGRHPVTIYPGW